MSSTNDHLWISKDKLKALLAQAYQEGHGGYLELMEINVERIMAIAEESSSCNDNWNTYTFNSSSITVG